jgi:hypothetical protein
LIDSLALIAEARSKMERDIETRLGLAAADQDEAYASASTGPSSPAPPAPGALTQVVFRVSHGAFPVAGAMSIVGTDPQLGNRVPNVVLMHDDGTSGDERAGDGVWTAMASLLPGTRVSYVYTNSGGRGRWEGLDIPHLRSVVVPARRAPAYLPVETFGRLYMQADDWHTDATGYDLIARAVAKAVGAFLRD